MDFAGTEPWLRTVAFAGIFLGTAIVAWWVLSGGGGKAPLVAAVGALLTIPAVMAAPVIDGRAFTQLALFALAGFTATGYSAFARLRAMAKELPPKAAPERAASPPPSASPTRVADHESITRAHASPLSEQTVALSGTPGIDEIAFLVDYSGDGHPYRLGADNRIGRDPRAEIRVEDDRASREHARLKLEDGRFVLYDLGSTNGTRLVREGRRRKLAAPAALQDLDVIEVGEARLVFLSVERLR